MASNIRSSLASTTVSLSQSATATSASVPRSPFAAHAISSRRSSGETNAIIRAAAATVDAASLAPGKGPGRLWMASAIAAVVAEARASPRTTRATPASSDAASATTASSPAPSTVASAPSASPVMSRHASISCAISDAAKYARAGPFSFDAMDAALTMRLRSPRTEFVAPGDRSSDLSIPSPASLSSTERAVRSETSSTDTHTAPPASPRAATKPSPSSRVAHTDSGGALDIVTDAL